MLTTNDRSLTCRQAQILNFIRERRLPPTIREIAAEFGYKSTQAVMCHLQALTRKGYIARDRMLARAIHGLTE